MKKIFNKLIILFVTAALLIPTVSPYVSASCTDPSSPQYTTTACVNERLGFGDINAGEVLVKRDPTNLITITFRTILAIAIIVTVWKIVVSGIKISGTIEPDKRKEAFLGIVYACGGLVIALSAFGITFAFQSIFSGGELNDKIIDCDSLNYDQVSFEVIQRCRDVTGQ